VDDYSDTSALAEMVAGAADGLISAADVEISVSAGSVVVTVVVTIPDTTTVAAVQAALGTNLASAVLASAVLDISVETDPVIGAPPSPPPLTPQFIPRPPPAPPMAPSPPYSCGPGTAPDPVTMVCEIVCEVGRRLEVETVGPLGDQPSEASREIVSDYLAEHPSLAKLARGDAELLSHLEKLVRRGELFRQPASA
jgi:hypothetical protein